MPRDIVLWLFIWLAAQDFNSTQYHVDLYPIKCSITYRERHSVFQNSCKKNQIHTPRNMKTTISPKSSVFKLEPLPTSRGIEQIVRGGRHLFPLLTNALEGDKTLVFAGWGKQAPPQAENYRDSLKSIGSDVVVKVAMRPGSNSVIDARKKGFTEENGTLGLIEDLVPQADMLMLLISDGAQTKNWKKIVGMMKPGATLGLSHGFLLGHLYATGQKFRDDINVVLMAPKGMGDSVRRLYLQGQTTDGAGINSSVAVEQDVNGRAYDYAIAWAVATGSPVTFFTTMRNEYISDITGERAMLLGLAWALVETLYAHYVGAGGMKPADAFLLSTKGLTSTVVNLISQHGLLGFYNSLTPSQQVAFKDGYNVAYFPTKHIIGRIYDNVASGQEIEEVVAETEKLETTPMPEIEKSDMWKVAADENLYTAIVPMSDQLAFTAGMYVAGIMAGIDTLIANGHCVSEAVNEQLVEGTDSLMPYMDAKGLRAMVDGCSITARLGTRKWGPIGEAELAEALNSAPGGGFDHFLTNPIHADITACFALRPTAKLIVA